MDLPMIRFEDFEYSTKTRRCVSKRAMLHTSYGPDEPIKSNAILTRHASEIPENIPFSDVEKFYSYFIDIGIEDSKALDLGIMTGLNHYCAVVDVRMNRGLAGRSFKDTVPNIKSFNYKTKSKGPAKLMMFSKSKPGAIIVTRYHIVSVENRLAIGVYISPRVHIFSHDRLMPMNRHSHVIVIPKENVIWS